MRHLGLSLHRWTDDGISATFTADAYKLEMHSAIHYAVKTAQFEIVLLPSEWSSISKRIIKVVIKRPKTRESIRITVVLGYHYNGLIFFCNI